MNEDLYKHIIYIYEEYIKASTYSTIQSYEELNSFLLCKFGGVSNSLHVADVFNFKYIRNDATRERTNYVLKENFKYIRNVSLEHTLYSFLNVLLLRCRNTSN